MNKKKDKDAHKKKFRPHIGMRTVKTCVAVFICCVIDFFLGVVPINSGIAAILCIQPDTKNSVQIAITRAVGTIIGGLVASIILVIIKKIGIIPHSLLFYTIFSLLLIPILYIPIILSWPDAAALTCIVYLVVAVGYTGEIPPFTMSISRIIDTLLGIIVALPVNMILPNNKNNSEQPE